MGSRSSDRERPMRQQVIIAHPKFASRGRGPLGQRTSQQKRRYPDAAIILQDQKGQRILRIELSHRAVGDHRDRDGSDYLDGQVLFYPWRICFFRRLRVLHPISREIF